MKVLKNIVILGGGSWGTALAISLARKGLAVDLWCRNEAQAEEMRETRFNKKYLPNVSLPDKIRILTDLNEAMQDKDIVVLAVTSQSIRSITETIKPIVNEKMIIVNVAKGLEIGSNLRLSQVVKEILPDNAFVALYGPSHAEEVSVGMPTGLVAASENMEAALAVQDVFISASLRVYTNHDLIGVEIGGALKNIIALANGIAVGLGYGDNTQAILLTRGLAEITRLGVALGANAATFQGLTGIGDLVVTCNSMHSRNRRCGVALGQGAKLEDVLKNMGMVVEGVNTTKAAVELAEKIGVSMPIAEQMYGVLFGDVDVRTVVERLMLRDKKNELE